MIPKDHLSQGNPVYRMLQKSQEGLTGRSQVKCTTYITGSGWSGGVMILGKRGTGD